MTRVEHAEMPAESASQKIDGADHGLVAAITVPRDGLAPGASERLSDAAEYDSYFRIQHDDVTDLGWACTVLAVTAKVTEDLPATSLDDRERAHLLDGISIILRSSLQHLAAQQITAEKRSQHD